MPKRVIDFDALWGSDKIASCADWAQAEYAWLYGLADASGCFELTNLRVIWGRVAAVRGNLTIERLEQVFAEFQDKGLLFVWEHEGKRYAHWTGSDVPGRLPAPSWRARLEHFAPPVPKQQLEEYAGKFARGRASLARAEFRGELPKDDGARKEICGSGIPESRSDRKGRCGDVKGSQMVEERLLVAQPGEKFKSKISNLKEAVAERIENVSDRRSCVAGVGAPRGMGVQLDERSGGEGRGGKDFKECVEEPQGQDLGLESNLNLNLDLNLDLDQKWEWGRGRALEPGGGREAQRRQGDGTFTKDALKNSVYDSSANSNSRAESNCNANSESNSNSNSNSGAYGNAISKRNQDSIPPANRSSITQRGLNAESNARAQARGLQSLKSVVWNAKELALARELRVGEGPVCGPHGVRAEVLERIRKREEAREKERSA